MGASLPSLPGMADCAGERDMPRACRPLKKTRGGFLETLVDADACGFNTHCDCSDASFGDKRQRCQNTSRREALIQELFVAHDLNKNGLLEELELIQLNKKIVMLHLGKDFDKDAVKAKYQDIFRRNFNVHGEPVNFVVFRNYMHKVLNGIDSDVAAQEMMLEQWLAEAQVARVLFHQPSVTSVSDLPFLSSISFNKDDLPKPASPGRVSVDTTSTEASSNSMPAVVPSQPAVRCTSFVHVGPPTEAEKLAFINACC
mmetsp:Transcript_22074/g.41603  ORF Transcript_22074/g.41603 Transcript_22074/m.41603 type:complete len:257 (+) Transcript_22074:74-844(+)